MIYLMKTQVREGSYYKVGYTKNLDTRLRQYITNNPAVELLEYINTYSKTKHKLETAIHNELSIQGYEYNEVFGVSTEWIYIPIEQEQEFESKGLQQFKACKSRKVIKVKGC